MGKATVENTFSKDIIPANDKERVKALRQYNLLDTPPDAFFQNVVHLAATHFNVPIALVSLVDELNVYFKGNIGMEGVSKVNRGLSLCSLAVLSPDPTVITKPLEDPCLMGNPLVHKEFGLRFYAAAPLITPEGYRVGAVCLVDKVDREFSREQEQELVRFSKVVMHDMELRLSVQKREKELEKEVRHRQKLITHAILEAQEKERSTIGIELHDNVNQILTTVKLYNEMALDPSVNTEEILIKSSKYLQDCINEIRQISRQLSAPTIGNISLPDSIKELIESLNLSNKINITLNSHLHNCLPVSHELHITIYRIIQEGLNNIIKHAQASSVQVEIFEDDDWIQVSLKDDGVGFDTTSKRAGIGITNMKTRAESVNGQITIDSEKGKGCQVTIKLPYYSKN